MEALPGAPRMSLRCFRDPEREGRYVVRDTYGVLFGVVQRHDHAMNGHFAVWTIEEQAGQFPTRRDAVAFLERRGQP